MKLFDLNDPRFYRQSNKKEESVFPPLINQTVAVAAKSALFWAPKGAQKGSFQFALNLETRLVFPVGRARFEARCRRDHRRDATRRTGRGKGGGGFTPWKERGCRGDPMKRQLAEWKCNTRPHVTRKHAGGVVRAGHPLPLDDLWVRACVPRNCHFVNALLLLLARGLSWGGRERESLLLIDAKIRRGRRGAGCTRHELAGVLFILSPPAPSVFWP